MALSVEAVRQRASRGVSAVGTSFATLGSWAVFSGQVITGVFVDVIGRAKFLRVVVREVGNIIAGSGIIAVGAGMVFVVAVISLSVGAEVGLQAFKGLQVIGAQSFTGLVGSFVNVREIAPIIYAI